ncbi:hypothetical protein B0H19DRAFT_1386234 [Mycena capillaripes]|nr:hypothetical protein B0H19DRAFT_1386234 [Mycena capillaripes]
MDFSSGTTYASRYVAGDPASIFSSAPRPFCVQSNPVYPERAVTGEETFVLIVTSSSRPSLPCPLRSPFPPATSRSLLTSFTPIAEIKPVDAEPRRVWCTFGDQAVHASRTSLSHPVRLRIHAAPTHRHCSLLEILHVKDDAAARAQFCLREDRDARHAHLGLRPMESIILGHFGIIGKSFDLFEIKCAIEVWHDIEIVSDEAALLIGPLALDRERADSTILRIHGRATWEELDNVRLVDGEF